MRSTLVLLHRWAGLFMALFLFVAGSTGAIIAWDDELDALLNPELFKARGAASVVDVLELAEQVEARETRLRFRYLPLNIEPGQTLFTIVEPRRDPRTGKLHELGFDQVAIDPASGAIQGTRLWGAPSLARENLLPFLYKLHYMLHLPDVSRVETGVLLMGGVAVTWFVDALIALCISFPNARTWRRSFAFRFREGGYRLQFDLHRSSGVWLWPLLVVFAFTAIYMNFGRDIVRPLVAKLAPLTRDPFDAEVVADTRTAPILDRAAAVRIASVEAERRHIARRPGGVVYLSDRSLYGVGFFDTVGEYDRAGLGSPWIYVDARSGQLTHVAVPGEGSAGDLFLEAQFPIHSGRIAGVAGRILVSLLGLAISLLSVTGLIIWAKKRRARVLHARRAMEARTLSITPVAAEAPDQ